MSEFTWVPVFEKIAILLKEYNNKQKKLIDILNAAGLKAKLYTDKNGNALPFNGVTDKDENGKSIPLVEIDPFTFLSLLMKFGVDKRKELFRKVMGELDSEDASVIHDFDGVPSSQGVKAWLFPYLPERTPDMVETLWKLFFDALDNKLTEEVFQKALEIPNTGFAKLTESLFYISPKVYFPVDAQTKPWLKKRGYDTPNNYSGYIQLLRDLKAREKANFYELSHAAWVETSSKQSDTTEVKDSKVKTRDEPEKEEGEKINSTNQILFGPPGTGKTYNTVNKAVETIAPEFIKRIAPGLADNEKRKLIKAEFNRYLKSGEIAFTTFHQSYSYEDFVEGIKAEVVGSNVNYSVEPGVFKTLCEKASSDIERVVNEVGVKLGNRRVWKMSLGDTQTDEGDSIFQECHSNSYVLLGYGGDIDFSGCSSQAEIVKKYEETGYTPKSQDYSVTSVNTFINKISVGDIIIVSDGNYRYRAIAEVTGEYGKLTNERDHWFQMRPVKWHLVYTPSQPREALCKLAFSQMTLYELKSNTLNRDFLQELLGPSDSKEQVPLKKPHVLIIDEINRGNISKIFGELITLIEPDKRKGAEEEISVILPYSKKLFSVPQNVHIIGTMNTADASIAKLDVALRRRFKFTEMPPKPSLLGIVKFIDPENKEVEINLNEMLKAINQRIELLYDRDHTIGHSFFMKLENGSLISDLAAIFEKEIIPLLQEYFFDDWERIHWVLDAYKTNNELFFVHKKDKPEGIMGGRWKNANSQPSLADVWELNLDSDLLLIQDSAAYIGIYDEDKNEPKSSQS
jgi:5-methylcytosine-specific restriction enzyme B